MPLHTHQSFEKIKRCWRYKTLAKIETNVRALLAGRKWIPLRGKQRHSVFWPASSDDKVFTTSFIGWGTSSSPKEWRQIVYIHPNNTISSFGKKCFVIDFWKLSGGGPGTIPSSQPLAKLQCTMDSHPPTLHWLLLLVRTILKTPIFFGNLLGRTAQHLSYP